MFNYNQMLMLYLFCGIACMCVCESKVLDCSREKVIKTRVVLELGIHTNNYMFKARVRMAI